MHKLYLSLLLASFTYAQTVNFEEVLNLTLQNNKDLKNQKSNIEINRLNSKAVESISYGKLALNEEVSRTNHSGYVFNSKLSSREATFNDFGAGEFNPSNLNVIPENLNNPDDRNNFTTKITYDIPLFTGFKLSNQKDILKLQKKANEVKYNKDKKELAYEVLKAYNNAVVAKDYIQTIKKAKEAITYVVKSASAFHNEGLVTKIDVKQALVYELNINSQLIQAENNFDLSIAYLKYLTSNDTITDVENLKNINFTILDKKNTYNVALENRDEIKMQNININAMKKNVDMANSSYYPSIYSHLEYGFNDNKLTLDDEKDYYMAMIGLNYTLFDNTRDIEKQKSKIELAKASLDFEKLKDAIKLELEKAHLDLKAKNKILKEKIAATNLAKEILEQSTLMYKNHLISMTNLLEQEANLRKNETQLIMAKYEKSLSLAKLALVLGQDFSNENKGN
jgi:outer membrane protein